MQLPRLSIACILLAAACSSPEHRASDRRPRAKAVTPVSAPAGSPGGQPATSPAPAPGIRVGDQARDFTLPDDQGHPTRLSDLRGRSAVLLAFYPKDFTGG